MHNLFNHLEVILEFNRSKFKAYSPYVPKCCGRGETKKIALEKLSKSIARFVSKQTEQKMKSVLTSDNYSEIIFDTTKNKAACKKIFNLNPENDPLAKSVLLRIKTSLNPRLMPNSEPSRSPILDLFKEKDIAFMEEPVSFGFPISFN